MDNEIKKYTIENFKGVRKTNNKPKYKDNILIEIISAGGLEVAKFEINKSYLNYFIRFYIESGFVTSYYLFINGVEVSDNKNYNPFYGLC